MLAVVCRGISHHAEMYVKRSVIFTASCILAALHPSYVASALVEGNHDICRGLEWVRTWALHIAESDPDTECSTVRTVETHYGSDLCPFHYSIWFEF